MSPDEFLSTGILEAYALGQASPDEARLAEEMRRQHPEVEAEYEAIAAAIEAGGSALSRPAPGMAWERIKRTIEETEEENTADGQDGQGGRVVPITISRSGGRRFMGVPWGWASGSAAGLVISVIGNLYQYNQTRTLQEDLVAAERSLDVIAHTTRQTTQERDALRTDNGHLEGLLAEALTPRSGVLELAAQPAARGARVGLAYDRDTRRVALRATHMPAVSDDKVVQLWAIVEGKPVSLGEAARIDEGQVVVAELPNLDSPPEAFALSLEPGGIHAQPQGPILAMAAVK